MSVFTFKNVIFNKADKGKVSVAAGATIDRSFEWIHSAKTVEVVIQLLVGHSRIYSAYEEFFFSHITEYWESEEQNKDKQELNVGAMLTITLFYKQLKRFKSRRNRGCRRFPH